MNLLIPNSPAAKAADRHQRLRLRRFYMSLASYAMWFAIAWGCFETGLLDVSPQVLLLAGIGLVISQLLFWLAFRTNINLRFRDPSLTFEQILVGLFWGLVLLTVAREIRGVILTVYMVTLLFGIFALDRRQFLVAALCGYLAYTGLVLYEQVYRPGLFSQGYYMMSVIIIGGVLLWTSLFGIYVSNLRYKLSSRNDELERALGRIRDLAEHDDLTGVYNRRYIMTALRKERARAMRTGSTFSICIIDLDHFKQVNDRYGHGTGDRVLRDFADFAEHELRAMDTVAGTGENTAEHAFGRYGGEEFIILLPNTALAGAHVCAERLRQKQQQLLNQRGDAPHVTLSAGIAEYVHGENVESLLRRADGALYQAKYGGRNQVRDA